MVAAGVVLAGPSRDIVPGHRGRELSGPDGEGVQDGLDSLVRQGGEGSVALSTWWYVGRAQGRKGSYYTKADHIPAHIPNSYGSFGLSCGGVQPLSRMNTFCNLESSGEDIQCHCAYACARRTPHGMVTKHSHTMVPPTTRYTEKRHGYTKRNFTYQTSNCPCSSMNFAEIDPKRLKKLDNLSGPHLGPRLPTGVSTLEVRAVLMLLAVVVSTCGAMPTHQPHLYPHAANQPLKKDWRLCCGGTGVAGVRPGNVTVMRTTPTSVLVTWTRPVVQPLKYEITYKPTNAKYRVVAEVVAPQRSVVLERLLPLTQYQVYVTSVVNSTMVWTSPVVTFHTTIDSTRHGNITGRIFSTPTVLGNVDVSVGGLEGSVNTMDGADHKVGLVRVRAEEVGIVLLVLGVWMFAIALFFNRWGKIRMLEPYQEPYKETPPQLLQHRPSCPMADPCALPINPHKVEHIGIRRPRQNSVFVGRTRSHSLEVHPPRRVKSALNLTTLVLQETEEEGAMATTLT
ncbi:uncharacterized protein [Panulirus ornatus]|uniref:uncharacterized protein n=1 Tax=Panulirus ornatus TaxID=150431 RepID=UPI003A8808CE